MNECDDFKHDFRWHPIQVVALCSNCGLVVSERSVQQPDPDKRTGECDICGVRIGRAKNGMLVHLDAVPKGMLGHDAEGVVD